MKATDLIVLEGHDLYIVRRDKIENQDFYSLFDKNGRQYGHEYAGDYSIFNKKSGLYKIAMAEGVKTFGEGFKQIKFWDENEQLKISDFHSLGIEATEQEVKDFLLGIERDQAEYKTLKAITWFTGQKWQSVSLGAGLTPYTKEDKTKIIEDYLSAVASSEREYEDGYAVVRGEKYKFLEPRTAMFYESKIERILTSLNPYTLKIKEDN